jgi:hypothetical protein
MTDFKVLDEVIDFQSSRTVVVRIQDWKNNYLVGDSKGTIVTVIPYQSEDGKQNALKIARQIVSANIDFTLDYDYDA